MVRKSALKSCSPSATTESPSFASSTSIEAKMTDPARTAAALLIGNELLSGKIHEANLVNLARTLRALGVRLERAVMVPDDLQVIAREVRSLSDAYDVVFTSGGVGP